MTNGIEMYFRNKASCFNKYLMIDKFDLLDLVVDSFEMASCIKT